MISVGDSRIQMAVGALLAIEHRAFGISLGLLKGVRKRISEELVIELLYSIDELSWSEEPTNCRLAIDLIALTWDHSTEEQREWLESFMATALSRLGVSPSANMLGASGDNSAKSYMGEFASALFKLRYTVTIGQVNYQLSRFQHDVLVQINKNRIVGISAPTSAGKSFAIYLAIIRCALESDRPVIYIVPTISLMNQVIRDLRNALDKHELLDWIVQNNYTPGATKKVFVLTQERAIPGELLLDKDAFGLIVVDEVQNIERVENHADLRAKVLMDAVVEISESSPEAKIIISGPRIKNIGALSKALFLSDSSEVSSAQSPVASITYSIAEESGSVLLWQMSEFNRTGICVTIDFPEKVAGLGGKRYTADFLSHLSGMVVSLGADSRNIIFSPTSEQARKTARGLIDSARSNRTKSRADRLLLAEYVASTVHPNYDLVDCLKNGIGFHTGKVPPDIRLVCEMAFSDGVIKDLVCTTTLMQGVNIPAKVVFVRNPNLYINKRAGDEDPRLSAYEFANLRGRAGRLMSDFVGRTVVLDGAAFEKDNQGDLFPEATKELFPTYKNIFESNAEEIRAELSQPGTAKGAAKFLCAQIRQSVVRNEHGAGDRLRAVGIPISEIELSAIRKSLRQLTVAKNVMRSNRYWDPFDLQAIKDNFDSSGLAPLPNDPWSAKAADIETYLEFQRLVAPTYFERYMTLSDNQKLKGISISAVEWARERTLYDIIKKRGPTGDVSSAVDKQVGELQRQITYGIPAVLKPLVDISGSGAGLLAAIESGVVSDCARMLVSRGLYRETAIHIKRSVLPQLHGDPSEISAAALDALEKNVSHLNYWVQRQVIPVMKQWRRSV